MLEMNVKNIKANSVSWKLGRKSKYQEIYKAIRSMEIGDAILVEFSQPVEKLSMVIQANLRPSRIDYRICVARQDEKSKIWAIKKIEKI